MMSRKCFICHLFNDILETTEGFFLFNEAIENIWIQGIVIRSDKMQLTTNIFIDDGTGAVRVTFAKEFSEQYSSSLSLGDNVIVKGIIVSGLNILTGMKETFIEGLRTTETTVFTI